jgi:hypothetical protein
VADVEIDGDLHFERQKVGTTPTICEAGLLGHQGLLQ